MWTFSNIKTNIANAKASRLPVSTAVAAHRFRHGCTAQRLSNVNKLSIKRHNQYISQTK